VSPDYWHFLPQYWQILPEQFKADRAEYIESTQKALGAANGTAALKFISTFLSVSMQRQNHTGGTHDIARFKLRQGTPKLPFFII
jgi:hypothetical protein